MAEVGGNKRLKGQRESGMKEGRSMSLVLQERNHNRRENIVGKCKSDPRKMRKNNKIASKFSVKPPIIFSLCVSFIQTLTFNSAFNTVNQLTSIVANP